MLSLQDKIQNKVTIKSLNQNLYPPNYMIFWHARTSPNKLIIIRTYNVYVSGLNTLAHNLLIMLTQLCVVLKIVFIILPHNSFE